MAGMPASAYAPLWPELHGISLHRPWLGVSRAALREYNAQHGLDFIDDPSNENTDFTRIRARQALAAESALRADLLAQQGVARDQLHQERVVQGEWLSQHATLSPHGIIETDAVPSAELLLHVLSIAAGQGGPIDAARRGALHAEMQKRSFKAATLSGAWVVKRSDSFVFTRDMVAVTGREGAGGLASLTLLPGESRLWDGRFLVTAQAEALHVSSVHGHLQKLRQVTETHKLFELPSCVRATQPVYRVSDKIIGFGAMDTPDARSISMTAQRLQGLYPKAYPDPFRDV